MITSYSDFLTESMLQDMVMESVVVYSPRFKEALGLIDSPVARAIEDMEGEDMDVKSNYFDLGDDRDHMTFVSDLKARKMEADDFVAINPTSMTVWRLLSPDDPVSDIASALGFGEGRDFSFVSGLHNPSEDEVGRIAGKTVDMAGRVWARVEFPRGSSILRKACLVQVQPQWHRDRQSIRAGRGARALALVGGHKFTDRQIDEFSDKWKATWDRMRDAFRNVEVVSGEDIAFWYDQVNYLHGQKKGTIGDSCMASKPDDFFDIYAKNPDRVSMVILRAAEDRTKIRARAIVWRLDHPSGWTFMDRIYFTDQSEMQLLRDYARTQGWHYKKSNDNDERADVVGPNGLETPGAYMVVRLPRQNLSRYPYMDTMKYLDDREWNSTDRERPCILTNVIIHGSKKLESTGGSFHASCDDCEGEGTIACPQCDGSGNASCGSCYGEGSTECDECDGAGKLDCDACDGTGDVDGETCDKCDGDGKVECEECDGDGKVKCEECGGDGEEECDECDGDGSVDCPECSG